MESEFFRDGQRDVLKNQKSRIHGRNQDARSRGAQAYAEKRTADTKSHETIATRESLQLLYLPYFGTLSAKAGKYLSVISYNAGAIRS